MIYFPQTRGYVSQELPVAVGQSVAAEGQALVAVNGTDGSFGVKPSAAASGEQFAGVAVGQPILVTSKARAESFVVPVGLAVTLARTPQAGQTAVYDHTAGAVVPASGGSNWTLSGDELTLPAGSAGHEITVYYKFAVTADESRSLQGDVYPGGPAGQVVDQIGVFKNGTIFTDQFDTTVNWNVANPVVKTGANGQFTIGGNGTTVPCLVVQVPSANSAFLGLNLQG